MVDEQVRELVHNGKGEQAIERYVRKIAPGIRQDGRDKVLAGITALEEVLRVTREE
jgi:general secretion pathway protein E